jgi:hypothetical protein
VIFVCKVMDEIKGFDAEVLQNQHRQSQELA